MQGRTEGKSASDHQTVSSVISNKSVRLHLAYSSMSAGSREGRDRERAMERSRHPVYRSSSVFEGAKHVRAASTYSLSRGPLRENNNTPVDTRAYPFEGRARKNVESHRVYNHPARKTTRFGRGGKVPPTPGGAKQKKKCLPASC